MLFCVLLRHSFFLSNTSNIIYFLWLSIKINAGASTFIEQLLAHARAQTQSHFNIFGKKRPLLYIKYILKYTMHTTVSWSDPKQWLIHHISGLMIIMKWGTTILAIVRRELGPLKTNSPTYYIKDNEDNSSSTYTRQNIQGTHFVCSTLSSNSVSNDNKTV